MPLRDQAGLYSPRSTSGASPDCSRIQPLHSCHAAWSHERGRKGAKGRAVNGTYDDVNAVMGTDTPRRQLPVSQTYGFTELHIHRFHTVYCYSILHLPHSLSCQLYRKRYEMTRPPSNVKPRPPPLCGPFGWTGCRWGAVHGQPRGREGRP